MATEPTDHDIGEAAARASREALGGETVAQVTARRWREAQADVPDDFTDQDLLRSIAASTNRAAHETRGVRVATQWAAIGVWVIALAVLAGLFGLITIEFRPL